MLKPTNVYFIKGIAITIIVLYHIHGLESYFAPFIETLALPVFMLMSGYLYFKYSRGGGSFYLKKIKRLLIPYLLWGILYSIFKYSYFVVIAGTHVSLGNAIVNLLINPRNSLAVYLWFIYTLFIIMAIVHVLKDKYLIFLFIASLIFNYLPTTNILCIQDVFHYLPFFILGKVLVDKQWKINYWYLVSASTLYLLSIFYFDDSLLSGVLGCIMLITISVNIKKELYVTDKLGQYAGSIYFMHPFLIGLSLVFLQSFTNPYIKFSLVFVISITTPILVDRYLLKSNLLRKYLLGE